MSSQMAKMRLRRTLRHQFLEPVHSVYKPRVLVLIWRELRANQNGEWIEPFEITSIDDKCKLALVKLPMAQSECLTLRK